jgi:hypothetical protein
MITHTLSIILLLSCSATFVFAEDNSNQTDTQLDKKEKAKSSQPSVSKRAQVKTLEEFIPSEEVSADKPVAFPNDI